MSQHGPKPRSSECHLGSGLHADSPSPVLCVSVSLLRFAAVCSASALRSLREYRLPLRKKRTLPCVALRPAKGRLRALQSAFVSECRLSLRETAIPCIALHRPNGRLRALPLRSPFSRSDEATHDETRGRLDSVRAAGRPLKLRVAYWIPTRDGPLASPKRQFSQACTAPAGQGFPPQRCRPSLVS